MYDDLFRTINVDNHDCSLLIVRAKQTFLHWVDAFVSKKGWQRYNNYPLDESTVLLITKVDRFSEANSLREFIDHIKPKLLESELTRVGAMAQEFEHELTAATFDLYFEAEIQSALLLPSDFGMALRF